LLKDSVKILRFSIAPMMGYTNRHFRFIYSLFFPNATLFTEMIPVDYVINNESGDKLEFGSKLYSPVCQLGGNDPEKFALAAKVLEGNGFQEININCGCPSSKVSEGAFGVVLMNEPEKVAQCVKAIRNNSNLKVSIKCRIGIDDNDKFSFLYQFIETVEKEGLDSVTVHARKALLNGISPKDNRKIPPLNYDYAFRLQEDFKTLPVIINGGIDHIDKVRLFEGKVAGVMFGRLAYQNPYELYQISQEYQSYVFNRHEIKQAILIYLEKEIQRGQTLQSITRHLLNFKKNHPNSRKWRYDLSACKTIDEALILIDEMLFLF
jgi:tRNA-dihydrouridine synthase A